MVGIVNKPDINYGIWASNGDVAVPSSEKVEIGHVVEKPKKEIVNWIENRQDQFMAYLNQVGIPEWDSKTTYKANVSFVNRSGTVYRAKSQNIDKDPTLNQNIWEIAWSTYSDFYALSADVNKIKTVDGYLGFYVSKNSPIFNSETRGFGYGNANLSSSFNFNNGYPSIKKQNIIVAEFSGTKSGKDVVTFADLKNYLEFYKVGDLYLTTNTLNPSTILGYGTWARYAEGRAIVGFNSNTSSSYPDWTKIAGTTFGSYDQSLSVDNLPKFDRCLGVYSSRDGWGDGIKDIAEAGVDALGKTTSIGGNQPHNNVQPSIVVLIWRRVS